MSSIVLVGALDTKGAEFAFLKDQILARGHVPVVVDVGVLGTPAFAAAVLGSLQDAGFTAALVLTQPDRPRGRGLNVVPSPVKRLALDGGIPVYEPATLAPVETCAPILANPLDVLSSS